MKKQILLLSILSINYVSFSQNIWSTKSDFGGTARYAAVSFSIGLKGYLGTGNDGSNKKDFWEYDPSTDSWTQKADFGGTARYGAVGFSTNTKGYVGLGTEGAAVYPQDFWEYDPTTNMWSSKASFAGTGRVGAVCFSISNKGYVGTGYGALVGGSNYRNDFYQYDPTSNAWIAKAPVPGPRTSATGFSIGTKGYLGTGVSQWGPQTKLDDFLEYDPSTNAWASKSNYPGGQISHCFGFSTNTKGYIGGGDHTVFGAVQSFYEYNQITNIWTSKAVFSGGKRLSAIAFSINNYGYVGTGLDDLNIKKKDFKIYSPNCIAPVTFNQSPTVCIGQSVTVGVNTYTANGNYIDTLTSYEGCDSIVTTNLTVNSIDTFVSVSSATITANASPATYQWINCNNGNAPIVGQTGQIYTATANGSYAVIITQSGCSDTSSCYNITTTGIAENNFTSTINIYPNPFNSQTAIKFTQEQKNITIKVLDVLGKEIKSIRFTGKQLIIEKGEMEAGTYFLQVKTEQGRLVRKLVIQ